uniref:Uncharacterized protein n=1 Tax=Oryzias melastigma TaxID=30732 RepID=A0A3B3B986_ORYME
MRYDSSQTTATSQRKKAVKGLTSLGSSITCIICLTCVGSQLSINSSSARSFSGPVQLCNTALHMEATATSWPSSDGTNKAAE